MSNKAHFSKPFDSGTQAKLEIFRNYLKEWIPVFVPSKKGKAHWKNVIIYDFFAGEGKDSKGIFGSPLIILDVLKNDYQKHLENTDVKIKIILNEKDETRYKILKENVESFGYDKRIDVVIRNMSFQDLFNELYPEMNETTNFPKLMFLDQFGIKEISNDIFKKLITFKRTDFIFFISSSFIKRFANVQEFQNYLTITKENFEHTKPFHCHRVVFEYYKSLIPSDYYLAPFSIKKEKNIYGLIYGSNHVYGLEKFLKIAWKLNPNTGDANYNIDEESIVEGQLSLFEEDNVIKKIDLLHRNLLDYILENRRVSLYTLYNKTLEFGCKPTHCNDLLKKLEKDRKIAPIDKKKLKNDKIHHLKDENVFIDVTL